MTREELLEAIGRVDDDLIQEAEDCRLPVGRHRFTHWRPLAGGLAACLVLAAVLYLPFGMSGGGDNTTSGAAGSSSAAQEVESESSAGTAQDSGSGSGSGAALPGEPSSGDESSGGASSQEGGAAQDVLRTPAGEYTLTGEMASALPEGSRQLGVLFLEGEDSQDQLYTSRREYAGCMLWEGPDGTLYVKLPGNGYALARPAE